MPILTLTPSSVISGRLPLCCGVHPSEIAELLPVDELFSAVARLAKKLRMAKAGDLIVITGGIPVGVAGATNLLKVGRIR